MTRIAVVVALVALIASPALAQNRAPGRSVDKREVERIIKWTIWKTPPIARGRLQGPADTVAGWSAC